MARKVNEVISILKDAIAKIEDKNPGGGHSLIWAIRGRAAGQGMVFWPRCPKQGIKFDLPLS